MLLFLLKVCFFTEPLEVWANKIRILLCRILPSARLLNYYKYTPYNGIIQQVHRVMNSSSPNLSQLLPAPHCLLFSFPIEYSMDQGKLQGVLSPDPASRFEPSALKQIPRGRLNPAAGRLFFFLGLIFENHLRGFLINTSGETKCPAMPVAWFPADVLPSFRPCRRLRALRVFLP